jgi:hypothetical protein
MEQHMQHRRRFKQTKSLEERLVEEAKSLREQAKMLRLAGFATLF